jgi:hypothetical protein
MNVLQRTWYPNPFLMLQEVALLARKLEMPRGLRESTVLRSLSFNNKRFEVPANRSALSKPPGSNEWMDLTDNPEGEEIDVELK